MKKLLLIVRYIKYWVKAKTRYRIHSQFVFDFINNILRDEEEYLDYDILWKHRNELSESVDPIETVDFGAGSGSKPYNTKILSLGQIVRSRSHSKARLQLLYRLTKHCKPRNVLELGTAAGISTTYIKSGYADSNMITMEGCANLAARASESFKGLGLDNIEICVGNFDFLLKDVIKKLGSLDFIFFDGNHRKEPTLRYFDLCTPLSNENSIFVFDDIHWSAGMESAWESIKKDNRVSITIDLFWFGLVFFRKGIEKQNFVLYY